MGKKKAGESKNLDMADINLKTKLFLLEVRYLRPEMLFIGG